MQINSNVDTKQIKIIYDGARLRISRALRSAAERASVRGKLKLREDVRRAGFNDKLANTWRDEVYPRGGKETLRPTAMVFSKAPLIVNAFSYGVTIKRKDGMWLAIPVKETTKSGGRKGRGALTPGDAESRYDQDLTFIRTKNRNVVLAGVDKTLKRKNATRRKKGQGLLAPDKKKLTILFVMVKQIRLRKRLNTFAIFRELESEWPTIAAQELSRGLNQ